MLIVAAANAKTAPCIWVFFKKKFTSESLTPLKLTGTNLQCLSRSSDSTAVPNIVSLQSADEDKFGFSSSFHLFDTIITEGQKAGNESLEQQDLFVQCPQAEKAFFFLEALFPLCRLNLYLYLFDGEPCAGG